jgi:hypothetical protein
MTIGVIVQKGSWWAYFYGMNLLNVAVMRSDVARHMLASEVS